MAAVEKVIVIVIPRKYFSAGISAAMRTATVGSDLSLTLWHEITSLTVGLYVKHRRHAWY